jgi:hypothetical protein
VEGNGPFFVNTLDSHHPLTVRVEVLVAIAALQEALVEQDRSLSGHGTGDARQLLAAPRAKQAVWRI